MTAPNSLKVLARVLAYLRALGLDENREVSRDAVQLVQEAFDQHTNDPYAHVMDYLPKRFRLPDIPLPPSMPPVNRGSIGYGHQGHQPVRKAAWWRRAAWIRRVLLAVLVIIQTAIATRYALWVLPYHGGDALEIAIAVLFAILFMWISIGFWMAIYGFFLRRRGGDAMSLLRRHPPGQLATAPLAKTAIILPIYHEPIERTLGGLRAVYLSLKATGKLDHFDFFILSDSRSPDIWLSEQATWYQLVRELGAEGKLFYRRRSLNMHYKSGNVADFLRRWGRDYEYTVVLDADSLMKGETLVNMVQLMQLEPDVGILQTSPTLVNATTLFARAQQFANRVYGPLFTTGLAAFQLGEAAYWGHNAIFRNRPFMEHCGLRQLDGVGLFSGAILSHDFVEAAYMGRAGYEVWLEPGLDGSHEESPPTLEDELTRDKRWAKGNLQHIWLMLFEKDLCFAHRMAFMNGVMSYLASPLWFLFLALTTVEVSRVLLQPINYFPEPYALFPVWPEWHPQSAILLASATVLLLFLPKFLGLLDVMLDRRTKEYGGLLNLSRSVLLEIFLSMLLAPVKMLAHTRYVLETLLNKELRWAGQNRTEETGWRSALSRQSFAMVLALAWTGFAFWLDHLFFYWSLPVALPLILAAPTSVWLGRTASGLRARQRGYLLTPEELQGSALVEELSRMNLNSANRPDSAFLRAILDPVMNCVHGALARPRPTGAKQQMLLRVRERCLLESPEALTRKELSLLAQDRDSTRWLHEQAWRRPDGSSWGQALTTIFDNDTLSSRSGKV